VDNEPSELRSIELVKMYYDTFKHLTTLNVAPAVGIVAVNELVKRPTPTEVGKTNAQA
jgi:hypothetical protein